MNQYNLYYLDITGFMADTDLAGMPSYISKEVVEDAVKIFPEYALGDTMKKCLSGIVEKTGRKFVAIIDEWDAPVRDPKSTPDTQKAFLEFLRALFKSYITKTVFAAAYMTGILPIKKDVTQSAISEFREYSILKPGKLAPLCRFSGRGCQKYLRYKSDLL